MKKSINNKIVSLVVPCRNESFFIENFLDGIRGQAYPKESIEVVIADGMSTDDTIQIIHAYQKKHPGLKVKVVHNKKRITPVAFNLGIKNSTGDYILPIGAHSQISKNYISGCVEQLNKNPKIDCVGGIIETLPKDDTTIAKAITISLSHPFGTGNAKFRNKVSQPILVDTVFGGCYRREVFEKIGLYNERLVRSQDLELNLRLAASGGKILMDPILKAKYFPKTTFKDIFIYHLRCGLWVTRAKKVTSTNYKLRHYLPLFTFALGLTLLLTSVLFVPARIILAALTCTYLLLSIYFSLLISIKEKNIKLVYCLPVAFFLRHFGFGLGSFVGLIYWGGK
jgi:glycosyltransferase involved in cell wall biosynthesis